MVLLWDFRLLTPDLSQFYFPSPSGCCHLLVELPPPWCWGLLFFPFWPDDSSACPDLPWMQCFLSLSWSGLWRGFWFCSLPQMAWVARSHQQEVREYPLAFGHPDEHDPSPDNSKFRNVAYSRLHWAGWHMLGCAEECGHTLGCTLESGIHSWLRWGMWHTLLAVLWKVVYTLGCAEEHGIHSWLYWITWHILGCMEECSILSVSEICCKAVVFPKNKRHDHNNKKSVVLRKDIYCYVLGANMRVPSQNGWYWSQQDQFRNNWLILVTTGTV